MEEYFVVENTVKNRLQPAIRHLLAAICLMLLLPTQGFAEESLAKPERPIHVEVISTVNDETSPLRQSSLPPMMVRVTAETGDASVYVNSQEVIKIRSASGEMSQEVRALHVTERLGQFISAGGSGRDIKPGEEKGAIVVRGGQTVLVTIDAETAKKSGLDAKVLAFVWTNHLRKALGAPPLVRDSALVASRGMSPFMADRRAPLPGFKPSALTGHMMRGFASWYGPGFHGRRAASGERFDMNAQTAAHKTLPFNTVVKVTNAWNGKSTLVRITDRGPYAHGRIMDLSKGAANAIGMLSSGTAPVIVQVMGR